jgi:hypothetical protein
VQDAITAGGELHPALRTLAMFNIAVRNLSQGLRKRASTLIRNDGTPPFGIREHIGRRIQLTGFHVLENLLDRIGPAAFFQPPCKQKKKVMQVVGTMFAREPAHCRTDFVQQGLQRQGAADMR